MEDLACRVGVFTNLHLERNVPDVMQTERHQAALNKAVDTKRHNRVLVSSPLGEGLDSRTDRWPDEGEDHAHEDRSQTRDDRHEALTGEEAQILRELDAVEAIEHVGSNRTRDDPAENTGIRKVFRRNLFRRQMQHQRRNHGHGFHHDAIGNHCRQRRHAVIIGEAKCNTDSENQRHISKNGTARFCHNMGNHFWKPSEVSRTDAKQDPCDGQYGNGQHQ